METLRLILGLLVGGAVGYSFGLIQMAATRRHEKLIAEGKFKSWGVVPGSGRRVAYLMAALLLVQIVCPVFFQNNMQWWVSGGVVAGYAWLLFQQFQKLRKARRY